MKNYLKNFYIILLIITISLSLIGCDNVENEVNLEEKVKEELQYLDLEIISLINGINNISAENYELSTKEISLR